MNWAMYSGRGVGGGGGVGGGVGLLGGGGVGVHGGLGGGGGGGGEAVVSTGLWQLQRAGSWGGWLRRGLGNQLLKLLMGDDYPLEGGKRRKE